MTWNGDRKHSLPSDWHRTRRRILNRDPNCTCDGCPNHDVLCHSPSTEVDHIADRDNHDDGNLRGLCTQCHAHRSSRQGYAARAAIGFTNRPREPHPGLR